MKVLQINSVCGYGSTGRIATDLYKVLVENGHECLIAYGRGKTPEGINSYRIGTNIDNYVHAIKTRLFDLHGFGSKGATKEFIEKIKVFEPDVIHLHNLHGYYINNEILFNFLKKYDKPVVWTLHDCWPFTGHCAHFDYIGCEKWKVLCDKCPQISSYPASLFLDNSSCNYKNKKELFSGVNNMVIVTPSIWLANLVKQSYLKEYKVEIINNGIDLSVFSPKNSGIFRDKYKLENKFIILGVARWDERKGLKYFSELSKAINNNSIIVLVGLKEKQISQLPQNIIGIKKTNSVVELTEIYSAADVFINPTLEDNFPTTNLEALACGTPVITFNTGGSVESIDDSCGVIVPKGDIKMLIQAVKILYDDNLNKVECINKSKLFDKNSRYQDYINLYLNWIVNT
ncbi:MAG: glycosyltransferase [Acidaminococcaceae bacterium]